MSGGLTSYGRTDGAPPLRPDLVLIARNLEALRSEGVRPTELVTRADELLRTLDYLVGDATASGDPEALQLVITLSIEARQLTFRRRRIVRHRYQNAMALCAKAWMKKNLIGDTPLGLLIQEQAKLVIAASHGRDPVRIDAQETIGVAVSLHYLSALFGGLDLAVLNALPDPVDDKGIYRADTADPSTARLYLSGSSYNTNIVYDHPINDIDETTNNQNMVVVLEAKSGSSIFGQARMPKGISNIRTKTIVKQDEYDYSLRSAFFMSKATGPSDAVEFRNAFGDKIMRAHRDGRLVFGFVHGIMDGDNGSIKSDIAVPPGSTLGPTSGE